jgi:cytochrome P450
VGSVSPDVPAHVPQDLVQVFAFDSEPEMSSEPTAAMDRLRDKRSIVYAPAGRRGRGTWVMKTYELVNEALMNPELFSSYRFSGFSDLLGEDWPMPPMEYDPPQHRPFRMLLQPLFSPGRMAAMETGIHETVTTILDDLRPRGGCEFQSAFGMKLPTTVFLRLVGLPLDDAPMLLKWEGQLMHGKTMEERIAGARSIKDYLQGHIKDREANRRDDLFSVIVHGVVDGKPITDAEKLGACFLLYSAGLDTVAAALGYSFRFLALNPERQAELRANPEMRLRAIEELLRAQMNNVPGRWVTRDTVFHGVEMRKGDYVSLSTMFANRDPAMFADPGRIDFGRANVNRHLTFGTGPHNCIGSHLARRELRLALDAWLDTMPAFRASSPPVTYGGSVFGVTSLDLAWDA